VAIVSISFLNPLASLMEGKYLEEKKRQPKGEWLVMMVV
jgi:hypothetical protein